VQVTTTFGQREVEICFSDVFLVPGAPYNLLLMAVMGKGIDAEGKSATSTVLIKRQGRVMAVAKSRDGLAVLRCYVQVSKAQKIEYSKRLLAHTLAELWHRRLGHVSCDTMAHTVRNEALDDIDVKEADIKAKAAEASDVCMQGQACCGTPCIV
jgi:hypothetical protein